MATSFNEVANFGAFVSTTNVINPQQFNEVQTDSAEFKELIVKLAQFTNDIALSTNLRDAGYYTQTEFLNGQLWYPNPANSSTTGTTPAYAQFRQVFRKVIVFGALPNNTTESVAHNIDITSDFTFTRIYATASDTSNLEYIPIPYVSTTGTEDVELSVDQIDVNITTNSNRSSFDTTYVVLEYIKS